MSYIFNPYLTNGLPHHYRMDESTFISRGVRSDFFIFFISFFDEISLCKQNSPRWDAAICGVTSGAILFAYVPLKMIISLNKKMSFCFIFSLKTYIVHVRPPHRGGSNEYPQSIFWMRNKKTQVYPCKAQFCYIKVGYEGVYFSWTCFTDDIYFALLVVCILRYHKY